MAQEKGASGKLTDEQLIQVISKLLSARGGSQGGATTSAGGTAEISVGDILGEIVLHVAGAGIDIIAEIVTEGIPDVGDLGDIVGELILDIGKEVIIHIIVDGILDVLLRPVDPRVIEGGDLAGVIQERIAHARVALEMAKTNTPAPSSRELAILRNVLLKSSAAKRAKSSLSSKK
ncbi:MAG: hypothetical protein ABJC09_15785 [Terriglobia bacterium]